MEIFIGIKRLLRILGLLKFEHSNAKIEKVVNIFHKTVLICGCFLFMLSPLWFFIFRAETFFEKTFSFASLIAVLALVTIHSILMWKREQIFMLFAEFEFEIFKRNVG